MNKAALVELIIAQLKADLATQTNAAHLARDEAISEESRAESKWDTHSQEAAYLAEGQAKIAMEINASISFYQRFAPVDFSADAPIAAGALVELKSGNRASWYFLGPKAGGTEVRHGTTPVLVLTPQSPLGGQLLGRRVGDLVSVGVAGGSTKQRIATVR